MRLPAWAEWNESVADTPWTVGVEEEVMLLDPVTWMPASRSEEVLAALDEDIVEHTAAETHGSAVELATDPHTTVAEVVAQLARLREGLAAGLGRLGLAGGVAGTHPLARWQDTEVSPGARYQFLYASMRELARREPTFALHVHVAVPDADAGLRALNGVRERLPILLALSANSPFWQGRDSGLASARTPVFATFPRTGPPRHFPTYAAYVEAIDVLLRTDAIPEPTFVWWDVRLQPALGTLELRIMDAQTRVTDTAGLAALVQALVRHEALEGSAEPPSAREVLEENRFLAARDGMQAKLVDAEAGGRRVALREVLHDLLDACAPHAEALGASAELDSLGELCERPGNVRQRALAARPGGLPGVVRGLSADFVSSRRKPAALRA
ncbi:MAG: glutamate---cysteine ligase / carboxylate-amine ligase [Solirubrobacteraceae bacterium]|nr:glutamate---cysteine ligase / carboxylate-amine ligase [Solirubrobacteraceae bacterium]